MRNGTADRVTLNAAAQVILRVMIASYFLAVALGIIPGTNLALLFSWAIPDMMALALSAGIVFILSFMIMIAIYTRVAALILGLMVFYASYLSMVELGVAQELGGFWRDLALIAALLLTYHDHGPSYRGRRAPIQRRVAPRRVAAIMARVEAEGAKHTPRPLPAWADADTVARPMPPRRKGVQAMLDRAEAHLEKVAPGRAEPTPLRPSLAERIAATPVDPEIDNIFCDGECSA